MGDWGLYMFTHGTQLAHKTYTTKVSAMLFVPRWSVLEYCFENYDSSVTATTPTISWTSSSFNDAATYLETQQRNFETVGITVNNFLSTGVMDVEDPCDIQLDLTLSAGAQDILEYYEGNFDTAACVLEDTFCPSVGTPALSATPPDSCLSFQGTSPQFQYDRCDHTESTADLTTTVKCEVTNSGAPASLTKDQAITLHDNELFIRDCNDQTVTIHDSVTFTVYLEYEGDSSADFSDVDYTITYDGVATPAYVTESENNGSMEIKIEPNDCAIYDVDTDKILALNI